MNDLLFAVPWWIPTLLAIIGVVAFLKGNSSQTAKVRNIGLGLVALAIVWSLVSYLVDTDKEKVEKETHALLQSVVDGATTGDFNKFKAKLTPDVIFQIGSGSAKGQDLVTNIARNGAETVKLKTAHLQEITLDETGTVITLHCDIFTTEEFAQPVETSSWDFDWVKTGDGWKVERIQLRKLKDVDQLDGVGVLGRFK